MTTDADRAKAAEVVHAMNPEHAYVDEFVYDGDVEPLVDAIAAALADARAEADQLRDAMRALAEENERKAEMARQRFPDSGMAAAYQSCADRVRDLVDRERR